MLGWVMGATAVATFGAHVISTTEWFVIVVVSPVSAFAIGWLVQFAADGVWDLDDRHAQPPGLRT